MGPAQQAGLARLGAGAPRPLRAREPAPRALAAVDAGGSKEHDRVLNLLVLESPQPLEVLGNNAEGPGLVAVDELAQQKRGQYFLQFLVRGRMRRLERDW